MAPVNPYDALPYRCLPIEWTAPERLAVASLLHGGPRPSLESYRVLELGCGDGANLIPLAYYRSHATFVGVDGAFTQIEHAVSRQSALALSNVEFVHADFLNAGAKLAGQFDYIIAHGIFSWVPDDVRHALFELCAQHLCRDGLLYLNYNTRPGWNVRGLVREFLLAQTAQTADLPSRAEQAQQAAARVVSSLITTDHPYSQLIANEFRFVCENHVSYVAHEYLAVDNQPFWRSEFLKLARSYGFEYVADADFNYSTGRISQDIAPRLLGDRITGRSLDDTVDLFCYRQLHSPILTPAPFSRQSPTVEQFSNLLVASCLAPAAPTVAGRPMFEHPSGYTVEAKEEVMAAAFRQLYPLWPRGLGVAAVFPSVHLVIEDLMLLHRSGLIELRCIEPGDSAVSQRVLHSVESSDGYVTTPYHTRVEAPSMSTASVTAACPAHSSRALAAASVSAVPDGNAHTIGTESADNGHRERSRV